MQSNIDDILAYEIKKELADRYFGFRKMIEEDTIELTERIKQHSLILEKRICFELIRIYTLLQDEELINRFIEIIGWPEVLYYDPYLTESPTIRERVFQGIKKRGLTRSGRFKNLFWDSYERLGTHVAQYREELQGLIESREDITEEIRVFYRQHDIGNIMSFLRGLNGAGSTGSLEGETTDGLYNHYGKTMRVEPPLPVEQLLPTIQPIAPLPAVRKELKKLIDKAYRRHGDSFMETLGR
jgi:hypothetical protein